MVKKKKVSAKDLRKAINKIDLSPKSFASMVPKTIRSDTLIRLRTALERTNRAYTIEVKIQVGKKIVVVDNEGDASLFIDN